MSAVETASQALIIRMVRQWPQSYERLLVKGLIHSLRFYRARRSVLCVYNQEKKTWRKDFTIPRYNTLFGILDTFWRLYDGDLQLLEDLFIPKEQLQALIIDQANTIENSNPIYSHYTELLDEIEVDFYVEAPSLSLLRVTGGNAFSVWMNSRVTAHTINQINSDSALGFLTMEDLQDTLSKRRRDLAVDNSTTVNAGVVMDGSVSYWKRIESGIVGLDIALGGGFGKGETTIIAGINGGGKTVLACQLAVNFAKRGRKVALFTTEQSPQDLIARMVCYYTGTGIDAFTDRKDMPILASDNVEYKIKNIPDILYQDPSIAGQLHAFRDLAGKNIYCVDWSKSQGYTIPGHFENTMDQLTDLDWDPDVAIFDWLGGGKEQRKDTDLRLLYQESADCLVDYGKKRNKVVIMTAQIDKTKVHGKKRIQMHNLSECKTMTNNVSAFIGISALTDAENDEGTKQNLSTRQFLNVEKSRKGPGGMVAVDINFRFQKFSDASRNGT